MRLLDEWETYVEGKGPGVVSVLLPPTHLDQAFVLCRRSGRIVNIERGLKHSLTPQKTLFRGQKARKSVTPGMINDTSSGIVEGDSLMLNLHVVSL